jgi:hypothetical protein
VINQARANWIFDNVFPFLAVAFVMANEMIEKPALPMWAPCGNYGRQCSLEDANPLVEREIIMPGDKQMDVIRHDNNFPTAIPCDKADFENFSKEQ